MKPRGLEPLQSLKRLFIQAGVPAAASGAIPGQEVPRGLPKSHLHFQWDLGFIYISCAKLLRSTAVELSNSC